MQELNIIAILIAFILGAVVYAFGQRDNSPTQYKSIIPRKKNKESKSNNKQEDLLDIPEKKWADEL